MNNYRVKWWTSAISVVCLSGFLSLYSISFNTPDDFSLIRILMFPFIKAISFLLIIYMVSLNSTNILTLIPKEYIKSRRATKYFHRDLIRAIACLGLGEQVLEISRMSLLNCKYKFNLGVINVPLSNAWCINALLTIISAGFLAQGCMFGGKPTMAYRIIGSLPFAPTAILLHQISEHTPTFQQTVDTHILPNGVPSMAFISPNFYISTYLSIIVGSLLIPTSTSYASIVRMSSLIFDRSTALLMIISSLLLQIRVFLLCGISTIPMFNILDLVYILSIIASIGVTLSSEFVGVDEDIKKD